MNKLLQQALFIIPIAALIVAPLVIDHKNKDAESKHSNSGMFVNNFKADESADFDLPHVVENQQYAMLEPFADHAFFASENNPMNPFLWMQMVMRMMNYMQMTQMMQQMAAMPTMWMNPYMMIPGQQPHTMQQPMQPEEYEKLYKQQQEKLKSQ